MSAPSPAPVAIRPPRILIIDTETTGFSRARARVVELAVVLLEDGRVVEVRSTLVRASREQLGHPEARSACQTHGIPLRDLLAAPDAVAIGERLGAWYRDLGSPPCAAWPTSFDSRLCRQTWPDLALDWPPGLCIHRLWRGVMGCAPPRLELAAAMLHVPQPEGRAHRAGYDARLTAGVYQALLRRQEASRV